MSDFTENPPERRDRNNDETDFPVPAQLPPIDQKIGSRERIVMLIAAAIVAAFVAVVMVYGLRAFEALTGRAMVAPALGTVTVQGEGTVPGEGAVEVYFQRPFATTPYLAITEATYSGRIEIVEQKPDHFKVKNSITVANSFKWKAEGRPAD